MLDGKARLMRSGGLSLLTAPASTSIVSTGRLVQLVPTSWSQRYLIPTGSLNGWVDTN
jgi:hypothetical protein